MTKTEATDGTFPSFLPVKEKPLVASLREIKTPSPDFRAFRLEDLDSFVIRIDDRFGHPVRADTYPADVPEEMALETTLRRVKDRIKGKHKEPKAL